MMRLSQQQLAALCYADIFDYPLTKTEISRYQIRYSSASNTRNSVRADPESYCYASGFYFLKNRENILRIRRRRARWSKAKFTLAVRVTMLLRYIPTVYMAAVTGALAMENAEKEDDIDLFVVSKAGSVWTTRFLAVLLLEIMGKRRRPGDENAAGKICLNMFVDEEHLRVPLGERDVFSAHEVAQVHVLFSRNGTAEKFWRENVWIKNYLRHFQFPHAAAQQLHTHGDHNRFGRRFLERIGTLASRMLIPIEWFFMHLQLLYMKRHRTAEVIGKGYLRFHPHDARGWVIPAFHKRLAMVGLK